MGALADVLHRRFKLDAEHLPNPGTPEAVPVPWQDGRCVLVLTESDVACTHAS